MPRAPKLLLLFALYFAEGLPFGLQQTALPIYLRGRGVSLTGIGLLGLLAAPWMLKVLWAPLVDRWGSARFGRRKSWIVPAMTGLGLTALGAIGLTPEHSLLPLLLAVLLMNFFAATMDIAVDGWAVELLTPKELGLGNAVQVVGYKAGLLCSGGLLVWLSASLGFGVVLGGIGVAALLIAALTALVPEGATGPARPAEGAGLREIFGTLLRAVALRGAPLTLLVVATYKLGEAMADAMFAPMLVDRGLGAGEIGLFVGTYGMGFSVAGSLAGGLLATRLPVFRALAVTATLRVLPLAAQLALALGTVTSTRVIATTAAEHFFGGALTTCLFAFMMGRVDRRIGATHYALLATVEVLGKSPGAWASGLIAEHLGYGALYGLALAVSVAFLGLLALARRQERPSPA
jgi:PAT family beta-lactamase induction signal transducer AmpG